MTPLPHTFFSTLRATVGKWFNSVDAQTSSVQGTDPAVELYALKKQCSVQAIQISAQAALAQQMAEDYYTQVQALDAQGQYLVELTELEPNEHLLEQLKELEDQQEHLAREGLTFQEFAHQKKALADQYSKIVIELQICVYKIRGLEPDEATQTAQELLVAFQARCAQLDYQYQHLDSDQSVVHH